VLPGVAAASAASGPRAQSHAFTLAVGAHGVPRALKQGQTIDMVVWYHQNSGLPMVAEEFALSMWNTAAPGSKQAQGVTVAWQNPLTGTWQKSTSVDSSGEWDWYPPLGDPQVVVPSNYWAHINMRITFSSSARTGTWRLSPEPASGYAGITKGGSWIAPPMDAPWPQYTFTLNR
jgi:hypothetical protein